MKVLVVGHIHQDGINLLQARADLTIEITEAHRESDLVKLVPEVDAILVRSALITSPIIEAAPFLKAVSRHGVGFNSVDVDALTRRGIPLTIAVGGNAVSVAEHTLYLILALAKQSTRYDQAARTGDFSYRNAPKSREISGSNLLIIGFGRIGSQVLQRAKAFNINSFVYDPYVSKDRITSVGAEKVNSFHPILPLMDIITVHCPLNHETENIIGELELGLMKPSALVINTARGGIIDEVALHTALSKGKLAGAGLDVFTAEPTNPKNPLFFVDNLITSPHCAGVTRESSRHTAIIAAENVLQCLDGKLDPAFVVNHEIL
tara:strand:+ start:955 stop:1914 length:960 start_codon:yes stop_codon:yes gene_type:complete